MEGLFDRLLEGLINSGPIGIVLGIMLFINWQMVKKLFSVIETNTKALTQNTSILAQFTAAQNRRRKDFET